MPYTHLSNRVLTPREMERALPIPWNAAGRLQLLLYTRLRILAAVGREEEHKDFVRAFFKVARERGLQLDTFEVAETIRGDQCIYLTIRGFCRSKTTVFAPPHYSDLSVIEALALMARAEAEKRAWIDAGGRAEGIRYPLTPLDFDWTYNTHEEYRFAYDRQMRKQTRITALEIPTLTRGSALYLLLSRVHSDSRRAPAAEEVEDATPEGSVRGQTPLSTDNGDVRMLRSVGSVVSMLDRLPHIQRRVPDLREMDMASETSTVVPAAGIDRDEIPEPEEQVAGPPPHPPVDDSVAPIEVATPIEQEPTSVPAKEPVAAEAPIAVAVQVNPVEVDPASVPATAPAPAPVDDGNEADWEDAADDDSIDENWEDASEGDANAAEGLRRRQKPKIRGGGPARWGRAIAKKGRRD